MLHKKGDPSNPANYRAIALINSITKIFTSILADRIKNWCETNDIHMEGQNGFRSARSTEDNIFILNSKITSALSHPKGKLYIAFIDFKRAFDSIEHDILWQKLFACGMSARLIELLRNFYGKATMRVKINQSSFTKDIAVTRGVLQGDSLSPTLFAILLSDLEEFFIKQGHKKVRTSIELLLFPDDLVIIANNSIDLQDKLNTLFKYCDINKLEVNPPKSKIMIVKRGGRNPKREKKFKYGEHELECVSEYTYLGFTFTSSGLHGTAGKELYKKSCIAINSIWKPMIATRMDSWNSRTMLFNSIVSSTLLYCSGIWGIIHADIIDKCQNRFIKSILQLPRCTPGYMLRIETGQTKLSVAALERALCYLEKICAMSDTRFPKICLDSLIALDMSPTNDRKRNWYTILKNKLINLGFEHILLNNPLHNIIENKKLIIKTANLAIFNDDKIRVLTSSYSIFYKSIKDLDTLHCGPYLNSKLNYHYTCTFAQLRLSGKNWLRLKMKNITYNFDQNVHCSICNLSEIENLKHFVSSCPIYKCYRDALIPNNFIPFLLSWQDVNHVKNVVNYFVNSLKLRAFIVNE